MSQFDLEGKVALVTGGNGGIGLGMATGLAGAGRHVVIAGPQRREVEGGRRGAGQARRQDVGASMSMSPTRRRCKAMVDDARSSSSAGSTSSSTTPASTSASSPRSYSLEEWRQVLTINLDGAFYCSQAVYPRMKKAGGGKIINIGSMMSIFGAPFAAPYAASKGGIVQLTKALATAWAKDNIQVNAVLPGWIDTDLTQQARARRRRPARPRAGAHAGRPLGRARRLLRHRRVPRRARPPTSSPAAPFPSAAATPCSAETWRTGDHVVSDDSAPRQAAASVCGRGAGVGPELGRSPRSSCRASRRCGPLRSAAGSPSPRCFRSCGSAATSSCPSAATSRSSSASRSCTWSRSRR